MIRLPYALVAFVSTLLLGGLINISPRFNDTELIIPTPTGPGADTVYEVTNLDPSPVTVRHRFIDERDVVYEWVPDPIGVNESREYNVRDIAVVPVGFRGALDLVVDVYTVDPPISARFVRYDYLPTSTPTPSPTTTDTPSPISSPTATDTPAPTFTVTKTPTTTPTPTNTPSPFRFRLPMVIKEH